MNIAERGAQIGWTRLDERHAGDTPGESLQRLFYPRSVALVGASERSPWSQLLHANLQRVGFPGRVFAVNKSGAPAHGYPGYRSCSEIPETVDCAYLMVPLDAVFEAFDGVVEAGIHSAVVLTSGFAEAGPEGAQLQDELTRRARAAGVSFLGPNCLGFANLASRAAMTPMPFHPPFLDGKVALVSQSGATGLEIVDMAHDCRPIASPFSSIEPASGASIPVSKLISVVLPAPFGPISPMRAPGARSRSIDCATASAPKFLQRPRTLSALTAALLMISLA
jgi:predicted CoA-binding protein